MKRSQELTIERKRFSFWLVVMAGMHIALLLSVFAWQHFFVKPKPPLKVVSVSLVSLPGSGGSPLPDSEEGESDEPGSGETAVTVPVPEPSARKESEQKKVEAENVPVVKPEQTKPVPEQQKRSVPEQPTLKKTVVKPENPLPQTPSRQENLSRALDKYRQSVDTGKRPSGNERQDQLGSALARLQQKVASQGGAKGSGKGAGTGSGTGTSGGVAGGMGTGRGGGGTADPYKVKVASIIQKNWEFSSQMLQNSYGMEVYVHIFILSDGTIREIRYDKRAPSEYLNNSVKKALEKSSPLPPLPGEYGSGGTSIGFVFTPEGIGM